MKILSDMGLSLDEGTGPLMSEVAGMKEVKEDLYTQIIYPLKFPDMAKEFNVKLGGGILLYGPPGNGKTFLVKALAREAGLKFIYVNPSSLFSQWFGNFEKNITALFSAARNLSPCILFFDELDSLFPQRDSSSSEAARRGVSQFLNEVGGFSSGADVPPVVLLGATNVPWNLDPAVTRPGRFDRMVFIPPPDLEARKEMIRLHMKKIKRIGDVDVDRLGNLTEGYSAADIEYLFRYTSQRAFLNAIETKDEKHIDTPLILEAMKTVKPSVGKNLLDKYKLFSEAR
jgi:ATPases of the AAA+ class